MKPIDTHAHLVKSMKYGNNNLKDVIKNNLDNLSYVVNIGIDISSSKEIIELNKKYSRLLPVIGIHPTEANNFKKEDILEIEKLINDEVIAIGETGLDYHHKHIIKNQKESFIAHIELARKYELPIVIHSRNSHNDIYEIVKKYSKVKFLLHSWGGSFEQTKKFLKMDNIWYSFSGVLTFKNASLVREIFMLIPDNKILFETDAPWLTPEPYRGKTNYSKYVKYVIEKGAKLKNYKYEQMVNISNKNFKEFYKF